jgi:hypothetical protein
MNYKPLRYALTALFSLGAIALIGILSYSGMLYLTGNIIASIASAILAVIIEGEIYKRNILSGVGMILEFGDYIERDSYCNTLKAFVKNLEDKGALEQDSTLLKDYHKLRQHIKKLKHAKRLSEDQQKELQHCETRATEIESFFIRYIDNQIDPENLVEQRLKMGLDQHLSEKKNGIYHSLQNNIQWERLWLWLSMPVTVGGGIMAMLVAASQLTAAITAIGLTITPILLLGVWPVAGLAAVGFMLMTYNTFVDMIHHKKWLGHWNSFKAKMSAASGFSKILHVIGMALLAGLAVFATLATTATWWVAAQTGITLLPFLTTLSDKMKTFISTIGIGLFGFGILVFEYANSLESLATLSKGPSLHGLPKDQRVALKEMPLISQFFTILSAQIQASYRTWRLKPLSVKINPFTWAIRLIEFPFRLVVFIGHLISIGVTGDRLGNINPAITSTMGALQEGMTDIHYLWGGECHHHHSDLAGLFLNVALAPLKLFSAAWNYLPGQKEFTAYLRKEFGVGKIKDFKKFEPSAEWQHYEVDQKFTQEIDRLDDDFMDDDSAAPTKQSLWQRRRDELRKAIPHLSKNKENSKPGKSTQKLFSEDELQLLGENRSLFFPQATTKSLRATQTLHQEFPHLRLI